MSNKVHLRVRHVWPGAATEEDIEALVVLKRLSCIKDGSLDGHCEATARKNFTHMMTTQNGSAVLLYANGGPASTVVLSEVDQHDRPPAQDLRMTDYVFSNIPGLGRQLMRETLAFAEQTGIRHLVVSQLNVSALSRGDLSSNSDEFGLFMRRLGCVPQPLSESLVRCAQCQSFVRVGADWLFETAKPAPRIRGVRYR